jgi:hypothetical protein
MAIKYIIVLFVETPHKFITAKLSIRKPGSSSVLIICDLFNSHALFIYKIYMITALLYIKRVCELNKSHIISTDEDPGLRIKSFAVINLRGVSRNKTIIDIFAVLKGKKVRQPPMTKLKINGVKVEFFIDTRASVNILTQKDYEFLCTNSKDQISLRKTKAKIYAFGSAEPVELKGKFDVLVDSKRLVAAATFYITKGTQETTSILCCETSTNLHLITMNVNSVSKASEVTSDSGTDTSSCDLDASKRKENLLKGRHPNVFTGIGKLKGHEQKIHINTDVPPVVQFNSIYFSLFTGFFSST